jgi:hypothetical protein
MAFERLIGEMKQVGIVTLYFMVCFAMVLTLKKLFLAQYAVEFYGISVALVGALVLGKVVVVLDHTKIGNRLDRTHAVWVGALYKTLIYTAITFLVVVAEKVFHAWRETGQPVESLYHVWEHRDRNVWLATVICFGLAFAGYNLFSAIDRRLGEGTLRQVVFSGPAAPGESVT